MKQAIKLGRADFTITVFIPDPASTVGKGKTGLAHTDMTVSYTRVETDNDVTVTDVTSSLNALTNLTDAHNDWGWKEVSSTLAPGLYRLDLADAVLATGIWSAVVYVCITSGLSAASPAEFIAVAYDPLDTVRLGLTALPNAAADAAGGLVISDAGGLDADAQRADVAAILVDTGTTLDGRIPAALVSGRMDASVGAMASGVVTATAIADAAIDAATFAADVDAEILSYLVDDATRIDASALNTATGTTIPAILDDTDLIDDGTSGLAKIATDVAAVLVDTGTTLDGKVDAIKAQSDKLTFDGANHIVADARKISTSATAADNLEAGADGLVPSTCDAGSTTTAIVTHLTETTDDHYNGRVITFITGALTGQSTNITDYNGTSKTLTVTALTEGPAEDDAFVIA